MSEYETKKKQLADLRSMGHRKVYVPVHDDPKEEVARLVNEHHRLTIAMVRVVNLTSEKRSKEDGSIIAPPLGGEAQALAEEMVEQSSRDLARLERLMLRNLKQVPLWADGLQHVAGVGPLTASYLIAKVNIHEATKVSNLRGYCGCTGQENGGRAPTKGEKMRFSRPMRTRLYLWGESLWKSRNRLGGCKYTDVWEGYRHRMQHSARVSWGHGAKVNGQHSGLVVREGDVSFIAALKSGEAKVATSGQGVWRYTIKSSNGSCKARSAKAFIHATGRAKATDVMLEDVYTLWRAIEGLPVWPSYHAAKLGYGHGGKVVVNEPRMLSLSEARDVVGDTDWRGSAEAAE